MLVELKGAAAQGTESQQMALLKGDMKKLVSNIFKKKRRAATHILILMVSCETRKRKPYAVPVQYIPYKSLRDQYVRDLAKNLKAAMVQLGLTVVGMAKSEMFKADLTSFIVFILYTYAAYLQRLNICSYK